MHGAKNDGEPLACRPPGPRGQKNESRRRSRRFVRKNASALRSGRGRRSAGPEAGIATLGPSQLYVSLGDAAKDGAVVVRIWWKPLVTLIWLGALVMMAGGAFSLADRRLRVGAPSRKARRAVGAEA